jgi:hypothetical protein
VGFFLFHSVFPSPFSFMLSPCGHLIIVVELFNEKDPGFSRPFGTGVVTDWFPALKRRAIIGSPSGTGEYKMAPGAEIEMSRARSD